MKCSKLWIFWIGGLIGMLLVGCHYSVSQRPSSEELSIIGKSSVVLQNQTGNEFKVVNLTNGKEEPSLIQDGIVNLPAFGDYQLQGDFSRLIQLRVGGKAKVNGKNIYLDRTTLVVDDDAELRLQGEMKNLAIIGNKNAAIELWWNGGDTLTLKLANSAKAKIAGKIAKLVAELSDSAQLRAEALRTRAAKVKAGGSSFVKVRPEVLIDAEAADQSNIYYFGYPKAKKIVTHEAGDVLFCNLET